MCSALQVVLAFIGLWEMTKNHFGYDYNLAFGGKGKSHPVDIERSTIVKNDLKELVVSAKLFNSIEEVIIL